MNYGVDYFSMALVFIGIAIGGYLIIVGKIKASTLKQISSFILLGIIVTIISVILNCYRNDNWGSDFISAYLLFKDVGKTTRILLVGGYIIVSLGIALLVPFVRSRREQKEK